MDKFIINSIKAREILDSRGNPTVEADIATNCGFGRASVPSGASTGTFEAVELRDGGKRFHGKGVLKACKNVNTIIAPVVVGMDSRAQAEIDRKMSSLDGTENKARLGANAILSVSLASAKAAANTSSLPLYEYLNKDSFLMPVPFMNVINGGKHAGNGLAIQEFMIAPLGASTLKEALQIGSEVYVELSKILKNSFGPSAINVGDEGGFAPPISDSRQALDSLVKAIGMAGYSEESVKIAIDSAASNFFLQGKYLIDNKLLAPSEMISFYESILSEYPVISLEDPFEENDYNSFSEITKSVGKKAQIMGDDIFVTNMKRFREGVKMNSANSLLLKVNQIGTLTEAMEVAKFAFDSGYTVMVSHRSGETEDSYIADIAVALGSGQIKAGAPARGERISKYNQLLRIEELLGSRAKYPGKKALGKK